MFENIAASNTQGLQASDYTTALNILKNKDEYRFATLALPGVYHLYFVRLFPWPLQLALMAGLFGKFSGAAFQITP